MLSPEVRACLACARAVVEPARLDEFRAALAGCADADRLCPTAASQGMLGHLHRLVAAQALGEVDGALRDRLAELHSLSAQRNFRQTAYLLRLLESLRGAGVETMPFKGPAWAERLYGDVTLRFWSDLDLLVRHDQAATARQVLLAGGFVDDNRFNGRILRRARRGWGEIAMSNADHGVHADLHWEITVGFSGRSLDAGHLFSRGSKLSLLGREVATPHSVDLLIMSCLHGTRHRWDRVEELLGLAVQVADSPPPEWGDIVTAARAAGCTRRVAVGVSHVCRVFGLETPTEVREIIDRDCIARALLRSLGPETLDHQAASGSRAELVKLGWVFATEDSIVAAVWHGSVRFFRPGPADWDGLDLPGWAEWAYYLVRPPRLALKWLRRLF
ncbi:MAG: nucleotidyltransferase family protein [Thermoleophilia bacterium]|nr:nucleotidyltransferase family protein [Thermoleophilia bacterium]